MTAAAVLMATTSAPGDYAAGLGLLLLLLAAFVVGVVRAWHQERDRERWEQGLPREPDLDEWP